MKVPVSGCCLIIWTVFFIPFSCPNMKLQRFKAKKSRTDGMQILYMTSLHAYFKRQ